MQKCVCKGSLCVTACCFHTSIIGWETERMALRSCENYAVFPRLIEVLMLQPVPPRRRTAWGTISPPWSSLLMTITVAFVRRGVPSLSARVSKCYRLIFPPRAANRHKRRSFELQIGIKNPCVIQTMALMSAEIKEMSSNVNLPPPCHENAEK